MKRKEKFIYVIEEANYGNSSCITRKDIISFEDKEEAEDYLITASRLVDNIPAIIYTIRPLRVFRKGEK